MHECCVPMSWSTIHLVVQAIYIFSEVSDDDILDRTCFGTSSRVLETTLLLVFSTLMGIRCSGAGTFICLSHDLYFSILWITVQWLDKFKIAFLVAISEKKSMGNRVDSLLPSTLATLWLTVGPFFHSSCLKAFLPSPFTYIHNPLFHGQNSSPSSKKPALISFPSVPGFICVV